MDIIKQLEKFTDKELEAEVKRRAHIRKEKRDEELRLAKKCRNCKFVKPRNYQTYTCPHQTYSLRSSERVRNRVIPGSFTCEHFEYANNITKE